MTTQQRLTCFRCGDGNTPLYCLNCASTMTTTQRERMAFRAGANWTDALLIRYRTTPLWPWDWHTKLEAEIRRRYPTKRKAKP